MLLCEIGDAESLREIVQGLAAAEGRLRQLELDGAPKRSTLAYASKHRPAEMCQDLFHQLSAQLRGQLPGHRFEFNSELESVDSSLITLCARSSPWGYDPLQGGREGASDARS